MISSDFTKNKRDSAMNGGYIYAFDIDDRVNIECSIIEIPYISGDLIGHKVLISNGVSSTDGIVIGKGYIFFLFKTNLYYTKGSTIYVLNQKYQMSLLRSIYARFRDALNRIIIYVKTIKRATVDTSILIAADYDALAGTTPLSDNLETLFKIALATAIGITKERILVTSIKPGIIINFTIMESLVFNEPTPIDISEELRFQLSDIHSAIYKDAFLKNAKTLTITVKLHNLSIADDKFDFMRDYNLRIYEKIVNDRLDILGDMFNNLNIAFE